MTAARRPGIVTLTSDFGTRDGYVGAMKGRLLTIDAALRLVDLTHDLPPFDVMACALALRAAVPHFPRGTVHLAVVDPGVGGARRALVVDTGREFLVGPDNGLFTPFLDGARVRAIDSGRVAGGAIAPTFHGRDLFAPVAAALAKGKGAAGFGPAVDDPIRLDWPVPMAVKEGTRGVILAIDRFGSAMTNLPGSLLDSRHGSFAVLIGRGRSRRTLRVVRTYADGRRGELVALVGSSDLLEIARVEGDAAGHASLRPGDAILLVPAGQLSGSRASRSRREM